MARSSLLAVTAVLLAVAAQCTPSSSPAYWNFHCSGGNFTVYGRHLDAVAAVLPGIAASSPLLYANETRGGAEAAVHAVALSRSTCTAASSGDNNRIGAILERARKALVELILSWKSTPSPNACRRCRQKTVTVASRCCSTPCLLQT
jgi:hypothetical protein